MMRPIRLQLCSQHLREMCVRKQPSDASRCGSIPRIALIHMWGGARSVISSVSRLSRPDPPIQVVDHGDRAPLTPDPASGKFRSCSRKKRQKMAPNALKEAEMRDIRLPVVLLLFASILSPAIVYGQSTEPSPHICVDGPENDEAQDISDPPEELLQKNEGDPLRGVTEHYIAQVKIPCHIQRDPCTGDYRLNVGDAWGLINSGQRSAEANAYWTNDRCGYEEHAGCIPRDDSSLVVTVDNAWLQSVSTGAGNDMVRYYLKVYEHYSDWSGPLQREKLASETCPIYNNQSVYSHHAWADTGATCSGSYGDPSPDGCNLPDVLFGPPSVAGIRYYRYYIWTRVCDSDGTNCSASDYEWGRFWINWEL